MSGDDLGLTSFEEVVSHYLIEFGEDVEKEIEWFGRRCRSLTEAIRRACLSQIPSGRGARLIRHSHQRRIPGLVLAEAAQALGSQELGIARCGSFPELFEIVDSTIQPIPGAGELLVYDVAHRLGGFLGLLPDRVYLHTGTRLGAQSLGLTIDKGFLELNDFPPALQRLRADQLEDVLCIYRVPLARLFRDDDASSKTHRSIRRC